MPPLFVSSKAHIALEIVFSLATQRKWKWHKQHEMYMANAKMLRWGPNATYISPACVGGWRCG